MKKITAVFMSLLLICLTICANFLINVNAAAPMFSAQLAYDGQVHDYYGTYFNVFVDNEKIESPIPPVVLSNGRSIVSVREIFESVGADVLWTAGEPSRVLICRDADIVSLALDDDVALVNGKEVKMDAEAKLVAYNGIGKTMVPVRFVAQTLGMNVDYVEKSNSILINTPPTPTPTPTPMPTPTPTVKPTVKPTIKPTATPKPLKSVDAISYAEFEGKVTVQIALSAPIDDYDRFLLTDPERVVVDLEGYDVSGVSPVYRVGTFVSQIRTGTYNDCARIVIDTTDLDTYNTSLSKDKKMITVRLNEKVKQTDKTDKKDFGDYKVVIDPGHGGSDPGAIGYNEDGTVALQEKDVTLPIANMVYKILRENGVKAYYTRNTDVYVTLGDRVEFANSIDASLFVSIHCNAFTSDDVNGTLVMHHTTKDTTEYGVSGKDLANNILKYLPDALGTQDSGRTDGSAMYVIRKANMPSVIVETAFITNEDDREKLADKKLQEKAAEAIAKGIMDSVKKLKK